jgi:hypothetical protein
MKEISIKHRSLGKSHCQDFGFSRIVEKLVNFSPAKPFEVQNTPS